MRLIGKEILETFSAQHADARRNISTWVAEVEHTRWRTSTDIKNKYPRASLLADNVVVFDINGNKYRIATKVSYEPGVVLVTKAGAHSEYNSWKL